MNSLGWVRAYEVFPLLDSHDSLIGMTGHGGHTETYSINLS